MENIKIPAEERSLEVDFDFAANTFSLSGRSFPENVPEFFGPLVDKLKEHFATQKGARIVFSFSLVYFNSPSAKYVLGLFDLLERTAEAGNEVKILWACEKDDDMQEMGEDMAEDLESATFELRFLN
ncbi:MAG: DUF1987 domain-containing protein [Proteobacteria bacterium]|nr:DUF1987 domain-containing protein [Pseudomonadota bacterium]